MTNEVPICIICGEQPCKWTVYKECLIENTNLMYSVNNSGDKFDTDGNPIKNNYIRKCLYQIFTHLKYGHLGREHHIPILGCIQGGIRMLFLDNNIVYMRFCNK